MISLRLCDRVLGLVSTLLLARLLVPADFGLIAMAMSFIALIELASAFNFEIALIQRADPSREHYDTAWTLNVLFALTCAGLTAALAPMAARFYSEPRLTLVMLLLAASWAVQGLENIGIVNFRRRMNFSREFAFMFSKRVVGFVVTLALAFLLHSFWALIVGQITVRLTGVLLSYTMESYRPRFSLAARADLFSFSSWLLLVNVMSFGLARLPHFLVGRFEGSGGLGLYTVASEFARLPSTELGAPINRAVLPGLSRLSGDRPAMQRVFIDVIGMTFSLTLPASIGLAMVAGLLVRVVLGSQWAEAAPLLVVLAISGAIEVITANNGVAFLVLGKTRVAAAITAIKLAALVAFAAALFPRFGVLGMAMAELCASAFGVFISTSLLLRGMQLRLRTLLAITWRPIVASALMSGGIFALLYSFSAHSTLAASVMLVCALGVGAFVYLAALLTLWRFAGRPDGAESVLLGRARLFRSDVWPSVFAKA